MNHSRKRWQTPRRHLSGTSLIRLPWFWLVSLILLIALLWSGVESVLSEQRKAIDHLTSERAHARATSYQLQLTDLSDRLDQVTDLIIHEWQSSTHTPAFAQIVAGLLPTRYPTYLAITDAQGKLRHASFATKEGNVSGQAFFQALRERCCEDWQVTAPAFDSLIGTGVVRFSKRLERPDGTFAGVLIFAAAPNFLATFQDERVLNPGDFITVRVLNGPVIATKVAPHEPPTIFYREHPRFPTPNGVEHVPGDRFIDGQSRYVAWANHPTLPLVALAAISESSAFTTYDQTASEYRRLASFATLAFLLLAAAGALATLKRQQKEAAEFEVRQIYRAATEAAKEGFFMLRPVYGSTGNVVDLRVEDCNEQAGKIFGLDRYALLNHEASAVLPTAAFVDILSFARRAIEHGAVEEERRVPAIEQITAEWLHRRAVAVGSGIALSLRDITETKAHEQHLQTLAHRDVLTGLPNRQWFMTFLPEAINRARQAHLLMALMFIDLDNFKAVNDTLGHEAGDQLLCEVATLLRDSVRSSDQVVRLAGDEFVIIVEQLEHAQEAEFIGQKIIDRMYRNQQRSQGPASRVNVSIGISLFPHDGSDAETLLRNADFAMYAAKSAGKGTCRRYQANPGPVALASASTA